MSRERRRQYGVCNRTHSLGISQVDDVPPRRAETPAELAEARRKDVEMMKQVLMEVMVEDGLPVMNRGGPNGPPDGLGRARRRRAATRATIHPLPLRSGPLRARASMVWSPPVAEHAEAAFCGARAAWATP